MADDIRNTYSLNRKTSREEKLGELGTD